MTSISQHCILRYKKKYDKRVELDLFKLVKVLGFSSSLVGGGGVGGGGGGGESNLVGYC